MSTKDKNNKVINSNFLLLLEIMTDFDISMNYDQYKLFREKFSEMYQ